MTGADLLFYALAFLASGASLVSALRRDLGAAAMAALVAGAAVTGLLALAVAAWPAAFLGGSVAAGFQALRRGTGEGAKIADGARDADATLPTRLRSAALVIAFLVILSRAVLMTGWPIARAAAHAHGAAVAAVPPVGLAHYFVVSLVLLAIGLFAAISRRTVAGVGLGLATASVAAVLALGAVSHFVGGSASAEHFAALVVLLGVVSVASAVRVALDSGDLARSSDAAWRAAGTISTVLAGVTLALLATAW